MIRAHLMYVLSKICELLKVFQVGDENITLPYWLSNASALLCLLQRNLRSSGFLTTTAQRSAGSSGLISRVGHVSLCRETYLIAPCVCI